MCCDKACISIETLATVSAPHMQGEVYSTVVVIELFTQGKHNSAT